MEDIRQDMKGLSLCVSDAIPSTAEGCDLLQELHTSVIIPIFASNQPLLNPGLCDLLCATSSVLSRVNIENTSDQDDLLLRKARSMASLLFTECATKFATERTAGWLQCLSSLVQCVHNGLLPMNTVLETLSALRQYVPNAVNIDIDNTVWYEWTNLLASLLCVVEEQLLAGNSLSASNMNLFLSAACDALNMSLHLFLSYAITNNRSHLIVMKWIEFLILAAQRGEGGGNVENTVQQSTAELMVKTLMRFCQNPKSASIDLADLTGRLLSSTNDALRLSCVASLSQCLASHIAPVLGTDACQYILNAFVVAAQTRSSYLRQKKVFKIWSEVGKVYSTVSANNQSVQAACSGSWLFQ
jgi:hypothetical protein